MILLTLSFPHILEPEMFNKDYANEMLREITKKLKEIVNGAKFDVIGGADEFFGCKKPRLVGGKHLKDKRPASMKAMAQLLEDLSV